MTMWYFWFALLIGVIITFLLVCKYNNRTVGDKLPIIWNQHSTASASTSTLTSIGGASKLKSPTTNNFNNQHYLYKHLKYNDEYLVSIFFAI